MISTRIAFRSFAILSLAFGICSCSLIAGAPTPTPAGSGLTAMSVREAWPRAIPLAQNWHADAYVRKVSIGVKLPNSSISFAGIDFLFESPSDDSARFVVACKQTDCKSFEVEQSEEVPVYHCLPVHLGDFQLDSQEVLEIGLRKGGAAFVDREMTTIELDLSYGTAFCGDRLHWVVQFADLSAFPYEILQFALDPNTGEEIEIGP